MEIIIMETVNEILSKLENADNVTKNRHVIRNRFLSFKAFSKKCGFCFIALNF